MWMKQIKTDWTTLSWSYMTELYWVMLYLSYTVLLVCALFLSLQFCLIALVLDKLLISLTQPTFLPLTFHSLSETFIRRSMITGSIARSANLPVFSLLRGRFWGFSPRTLHRWGVKFGMEEGSSMPNFTEGPLLRAKFHLPSAQRQRCRTPKIEFFYSDLTEIWNINAPQLRGFGFPQILSAP